MTTHTTLNMHTHHMSVRTATPHMSVRTATPQGARLWASDGKEVWEIWGSGKPIGEAAVRVHYWAVKHMPDPPAPRRHGGTVDTGGLNPPGGNPVRVRLSLPILDGIVDGEYYVEEHFVCSDCNTRIYRHLQDHADEYYLQKEAGLCMECDQI